MQEMYKMRVWSWVGNIPWRRAWQPTPVSLPGESHGQRSLASSSHRVAKRQTWLKRPSMPAHTGLFDMLSQMTNNAQCSLHIYVMNKSVPAILWNQKNLICNIKSHNSSFHFEMKCQRNNQISLSITYSELLSDL